MDLSLNKLWIIYSRRIINEMCFLILETTPQCTHTHTHTHTHTPSQREREKMKKREEGILKENKILKLPAEWATDSLLKISFSFCSLLSSPLLSSPLLSPVSSPLSFFPS